jgi:hypothetical protein
MRREFKRALKEQFGERLAKCDGCFTKMRSRSLYVLPRDIVYTKMTHQENVRLFVIVVVHEERGAFSLEIGWSALGRFPELSSRPAGRPTPNRIEFSRPEFVCRLADLFGLPGFEWVIAPSFDPHTDDFLRFVKESCEPIPSEEAAARVKSQVEDAIAKLVGFGLPYLDQYLRSR